MELAKCLNFTKAAMNLYIAQPALSQQIADLEKQLGVTLFERNSRSVILTPAGKILQSACPEILNKLENVKQQALWAQAGLRGSIKIGYLYLFQPLLPMIVQEFRKLYPDIALEFYNGNLMELENAQKNRDVDIAFAWVNAYDMPEINPPAYSVLWQEDLCLAVHKEHPFVASGSTDFRLLENDTCILIDESASPGFKYMARKAAAEAGFSIKKETACKEFTSIIVQIESEMGYSILPSGIQSFNTCAMSNIVFIPIKKECMDFGAVWYNDSKNAVISLFLDLLEKMFPKFSPPSAPDAIPESTSDSDS